MAQEEQKKSNTKKIVIGVIALVVVIVILAVVAVKFAPQTSEGSKEVTIEVVGSDGESVSYTFKTDAEYLRGAMEDAEDEGLTFADTDGYVETVNDETADYSADGSYWAFYVNDEYCNYGIDEQPVADGDAFTIEYTIYVYEE